MARALLVERAEAWPLQLADRARVRAFPGGPAKVICAACWMRKEPRGSAASLFPLPLLLGPGSCEGVPLGACAGSERPGRRRGTSDGRPKTRPAGRSSLF